MNTLNVEKQFHYIALKDSIIKIKTLIKIKTKFSYTEEILAFDNFKLTRNYKFESIASIYRHNNRIHSFLPEHRILTSHDNNFNLCRVLTWSAKNHELPVPFPATFYIVFIHILCGC